MTPEQLIKLHEVGIDVTRYYKDEMRGDSFQGFACGDGGCYCVIKEKDIIGEIHYKFVKR